MAHSEEVSDDFNDQQVWKNLFANINLIQTWVEEQKKVNSMVNALLAAAQAVRSSSPDVIDEKGTVVTKPVVGSDITVVSPLAANTIAVTTAPLQLKAPISNPSDMLGIDPFLKITAQNAYNTVMAKLNAGQSLVVSPKAVTDAFNLLSIPLQVATPQEKVELELEPIVKPIPLDVFGIGNPSLLRIPPDSAYEAVLTQCFNLSPIFDPKAINNMLKLHGITIQGATSNMTQAPVSDPSSTLSMVGPESQLFKCSKLSSTAATPTKEAPPMSPTTPMKRKGGRPALYPTEQEDLSPKVKAAKRENEIETFSKSEPPSLYQQQTQLRCLCIYRKARPTHIVCASLEELGLTLQNLKKNQQILLFINKWVKAPVWQLVYFQDIFDDAYIGNQRIAYSAKPNGITNWLGHQPCPHCVLKSVCVVQDIVSFKKDKKTVEGKADTD